VIPEPLARRDVGAGVQRVDHAAAGGARGGHDHHGDGARRAIFAMARASAAGSILPPPSVSMSRRAARPTPA